MTRGQLIALVAGGLVAAAGVIALARYIPKARFLAALPPAGQPYGEIIWREARRVGIKPALLAATIAHESGFGDYLSPKGPGGTGDNGHGHGLSQIDDGTWSAWLNTHDWRDPAVNIAKGAEILAASLKAFPGNVAAGVAAYNAGVSRVRQALAAGKEAASVTTHDKQGRSYVTNVAAQLDRLQARAQA